MTTQETEQLKKGALYEDFNGMYASLAGFELERFKQDFTDPQGQTSDLQAQVIDIPLNHLGDGLLNEEMFIALGETGQIDIFENKVMQLIIRYRSISVKKYTLQKLFIPYVFYLLIYVGYNHFIRS